jgi:hypothetical protein
MMANPALMQNTTNGIGSGISATIGLPTVMRWAKKLTIPNTEVTYFVGNSLDTETYPMLKDIDPPMRAKITNIGMSQLISVS